MVAEVFHCWINEHEDGYAIFPSEESATFSAHKSLNGEYTSEWVKSIGRYVRTIPMKEVLAHEA